MPMKISYRLKHTNENTKANTALAIELSMREFTGAIKQFIQGDC